MFFAKKPANAPANAKRFFVVHKGKLGVIFGVPSKARTVASYDGTTPAFSIGTNAFTNGTEAKRKVVAIRVPSLPASVTRRKLITHL